MDTTSRKMTRKEQHDYLIRREKKHLKDAVEADQMHDAQIHLDNIQKERDAYMSDQELRDKLETLEAVYEEQCGALNVVMNHEDLVKEAGANASMLQDLLSELDDGLSSMLDEVRAEVEELDAQAEEHAKYFPDFKAEVDEPVAAFGEDK